MAPVESPPPPEFEGADVDELVAEPELVALELVADAEDVAGVKSVL